MTTTTEEMKVKNFGLTKPKFLDLVDELKNGNESLFEKIFLSQFEQTVRFLMIKYQSSHELSYDICMDTLIEFRRLLLAEKITYGNLQNLFNTIATQKFSKHKQRAKKFQYSDSLPERIIMNSKIDKEDISALNNAWSRIGKECQFILKKFYYCNVKLYEIADAINKSPSATRKQKERCIHALRSKFYHFV